MTEKWAERMRAAILFLTPILPAAPYAFLSVPGLAVQAPASELPQASRSSPVAPADNDRRAPPPPVRRDARGRSAGWPVRRIEVPGWRLATTESFEIRSDAPPEDVRSAGASLEETLRVQREVLGGEGVSTRFLVRIFRDELDFRAYATRRGVPEAASFYDPPSGEVVIPLGPPGDRDGSARALAHEFCHQYLHRVFGRTRPMWLVEGLAEYFSGYSVDRGRCVLGGSLRPHRERIENALRDGRFIPLRRLLLLDRDQFYSGDTMLAYAEAWSLVRFLLKDGGQERRETIAALLKGAPLSDPVREEALEEAWMRSLQKYP